MDYFSEKTGRVLSLYLLIKKSNGITKKDIQRILGTTTRTAERDIKSLNNDFEIVTKLSKYYKYIIDFEITSQQKLDEIEETISLLGTTKFQLKADKDSNYIEKETSTIGLGNKYLDEIYDAIIRKVKINIAYKGFWNTETKEITISPVLLKLYNQRWYLIGKSNNKKYSLDRIQELTTLDKEKFNFTGTKKGLFDNVIGISQPELTPEKVVLLFEPRQGRYIKSLPMHSSQNILSDNDFGLKIEITVGINWELKEEIKKHGSLVKVINPLHLVEEIKADLILILKAYDNN